MHTDFTTIEIDRIVKNDLYPIHLKSNNEIKINDRTTDTKFSREIPCVLSMLLQSHRETIDLLHFVKILSPRVVFSYDTIVGIAPTRTESETAS